MKITSFVISANNETQRFLLVKTDTVISASSQPPTAALKWEEGMWKLPFAMRSGNESVEELLHAIWTSVIASPEEKHFSKAEHIGHTEKYPDFGLPQPELEFFAVSANLTSIPSTKADEARWLTADEFFQEYNSGKIFISPFSLKALLLHFKNGKHNGHHDKTSEALLPYFPHVSLYPITSNTILPFRTTNHIVIRDGDEALLVDPGANAAGKESLIKILKQFTKPPKIFITHYHHDHTDSLNVVAEVFPDAEILAHPLTLQKDSVKQSTLKKTPISDTNLSVGDVSVQVVHTPGHTDGHCALYLPKLSVILAGDHAVGFGSTALDPTCGNMNQYIASCQKLIALDAKVLIPAHGPLNFKPSTVLQDYINHRIQREKFIYDAIQKGKTHINEVLQEVYSAIAPQLHGYAKVNIRHHVNKLKEDGKLDPNFALTE